MKRLLRGGKKLYNNYNTLAKSTLGRAIRKRASLALDDYVGQGLYEGSGKYKGRGSYNSLIKGGGRKSMTVKGTGNDNQGIQITHKEYVRDIYGPDTTNFTNLTMPLNPGLRQFSPWLSQLAANYAEYELVQCVFEYHSLVEANNTDSGLNGEVIMATNYNPSQPSFSDKATMLQYHGANAGKLTENHTHGVECDPKLNPGDGHKYIRSHPVVLGEDLKSYDAGLFQLAIVNCPSNFRNQQVGELWVYYTIRLHKPRLYVTKGLFGFNDYYRIAYETPQGSSPSWSGFTSNDILGSTQTSIPVTVLAPGSVYGTVPLTKNCPKSSYLLSGQQNLLGCAIVYANGTVGSTVPASTSSTGVVTPQTSNPTLGNIVYVVFPDWFTGTVEIDAHIEIANGINETGSSTEFKGYATTTGNPSFYAQLTAESGNVVPLRDMWDIALYALNDQGGQYQMGYDQGTYAMANPNALGARTYGAMGHFYVQAATGGVDNIVALDFGRCECAFKPSPNTNFKGFTINVREYSAVQLGGPLTSDSRPVFVDSIGNAIVGMTN